jgi:poly[(R)-3-hydroxyalkanoate] polymerase subunit PhaC
LTLPGAGLGAVFTELTARLAQTLSRLQQARHVTVGCSAKRAVWSCGKTTLYEYLPLGPATPRADVPPLLICFALVNRPYVLDLQPERSLVRRLLEGGLPVYLIDWGDPDEGDRGLDLEAYIEQHLGGCVRHILAVRAADALDLLGVCQGGVLSLCYAALHPQEIGNLITVTAPVDFHTPDNLLAKWVRGLDTALIAAGGNVPGEVLNALFLALMPLRLAQHKYVRLLAENPDERTLEDFVRMEKWIYDSPPQAAAALAQFVRWFYQENRLVHGTLEIGARAVRLRDVRQPLLNLYALHDHIVPAAACAPLGALAGSRDYSAAAIATGHIGMYVSRAAGGQIAPRILAWLQQRR